MKARNAAVHVMADRTALCADAAERIVSVAAECVRERGRFTLALAGGATPNGVYDLLATKPYRSRIGWPDVHVFWGDERCVPPDDPRSNYRAAWELLLSQVPIPAANIHRIEGELEPPAAAARYESRLREHFGTRAGAPGFAPGASFDLVLLGVGTDGHTASIFPGGATLRERTRWVLSDYAESVSMWRITLTLPVINAASRVLMLVAGSEKRAIMSRVLAGRLRAIHLPARRGQEEREVTAQPEVLLPAQAIAPVAGELTWLLDSAAMPAPDPV